PRANPHIPTVPNVAAGTKPPTRLDRSGGLGERIGRERGLVSKLRAAFRAEDHAGPGVHHELAADEAFERRAAEQREKLLVERPGERRDVHSSRNTPTTLPRISTWRA